MTGIVVAGRGNLGRSLARALKAAGQPARLVSGHGLEKVVGTIGPGAIVFLAVPDGAVRDVGGRLAAAPGTLAFVHLSGALGLDALDALRPRHATGSFHPLQSFPAPRPPEAFRGITVAVDASSASLTRRLRALARLLGATPKQVGDADRVLYHAAAVFASNYLDVVVAEAVRLLREIGWTEAESVAALMPLVEGAVANIRRHGPVAALTGPIRRGDVDTVTRHLRALEGVEAADEYRMLGK
ncbi:MAG TPA: DUF2520 domain-containing protein, partial [Candidatus Dormibacteraeota bacterium]|nr:DUF2520 domain-containing protein [Candidatus Dormibacteraeota bacterium]